MTSVQWRGALFEGCLFGGVHFWQLLFFIDLNFVTLNELSSMHVMSSVYYKFHCNVSVFSMQMPVSPLYNSAVFLCFSLPGPASLVNIQVWTCPEVSLRQLWLRQNFPTRSTGPWGIRVSDEVKPNRSIYTIQCNTKLIICSCQLYVLSWL